VIGPEEVLRDMQSVEIQIGIVGRFVGRKQKRPERGVVAA